MKPIIGITPAYDLDKGYGYIKSGYYRAVQKTGGIPLILPCSASGGEIVDLADACDGFIFTGGQDFGEEYYGEAAHPNNGRASRVRDEMEFALMKELLKRDKPILGICRGMQLITLELGGRLCQDIPLHDLPPYDKASHEIIIEENSALFDVINKKSLFVNSCHHQAVQECGAGQEVMAVSADSVIEATYLPGKKFVWGIQWHPELMPEDAAAMNIFRALVNMSEKT